MLGKMSDFLIQLLLSILSGVIAAVVTEIILRKFSRNKSYLEKDRDFIFNILTELRGRDRSKEPQ